jgi:hypothetical protein
MQFEDVKSFTIKSDDDFKKAISLFIDTPESDRLKIYNEISNEKNITNAEAKDFLLHLVFEDYIKRKLRKALHIAQLGGKDEAYQEIQDLKLLAPIFKEYDVNTHSQFLCSADSYLTDLESTLLLTDHILSNDECDTFSKAIIQSLTENNIKNIENDEQYTQRLLEHPILKCLNSFTTSKALINNIENDILQLGNYKELVLAVLNVGLDLSREEHQRLLFFIINEDIKHDGLFNILKNDNYEPQELKRIIKRIIAGNDIYYYNLSELTDLVTQEHTKYAKLDSFGNISPLPSSNKSLMDSGFYFDKINLLLHVHTAQDSGNNQNNQQINTALVYQNKDYKTCGVSITQKSVIDLRTNNDYLVDYKDIIQLNKQEKIWLTSLQITSQHSLLLANQNCDIKSTSFLSKEILLSESDINSSVELAKLRQGKTDLENIYADKEILFGIIKKNPEVIKAILNFTSSDNQKSFQHLATPILKQINAILIHEDNIEQNILSANDLDCLNQLLNSLELNNADIVDLSSQIKRSLKKRCIYEVPCTQNNDALVHWINSSIVEPVNHLEAINNYDLDVVTYFINNPIDADKITEEQKVKINIALEKRIIYEAENNLIKTPNTNAKNIVLKITTDIIKTLQKENASFSKGDYNNPTYPMSRLLARLARDENQNNKGIKSTNKMNDDNKFLNLFAIVAKINKTKIQSISYDSWQHKYYTEDNDNLSQKIKIK